jgi:hypothetical protein
LSHRLQRYAGAVALVTAMLYVAAPGAAAKPNPNGRAHTVAPAKRKPSPQCADATKLNDAVFVVTDMPTGFAEVPLDPNNSIRLGGGTLNSLSIPFPTAGTVFRGFQQGTDPLVPGPFVADTAVLLQSAADAPKLIQAFRDAAASATTWDQPRTDPAGTVTYNSSALSFPKVGGDTLALRLSAKFRDAESGFEQNGPSADYVVWRHGPVVSIVVASGTDTLTQVKAADAKVVKILEPCPKPTTTTTKKKTKRHK